MFRPWPLLLLLLASGSLAAQASTPLPSAAPTPAKLGYDSLAFGRQLNRWLLAGKADSLWAHTAMRTQLEWGGENHWREIVADVASHLGSAIPQRVDERWAERGGKRQYWWVVTVPGVTTEPWALRWILETDGVLGMGYMPYAEAGPSSPN